MEFTPVGQQSQGYASQARRANQGFLQVVGTDIHASIIIHLHLIMFETENCATIHSSVITSY
ncbi:hypothetical protein K503DRAFT_569246 [Rhizopogon vinicolor AM-OR11-026]|uniref:Uncharacterized protein n=1 Tax=Rhizopogon vinicolor AM-OR11-026 TaxID=1314800 RepID=A0A1B7MJY4_9AGAM|nr:hypothetical protein K503DRAFT_569246 [Rhizopogon vinicolor AM-OR11-026]